MENEVSKGNGKIIGLLVFFIILSIILGVFIVYDNFIKEEKKVEDKINEQDVSNKEVSKIIIISDDCSEDKEDCQKYEVSQTTEGEVYASAEANSIENKDVVDQLVETQVVKSYIVYAGMFDVGDGRIIVFIKEDGTISALSISYLTISNEVIVKKNIGNLNNIVSVYYESEIVGLEYEPPMYRVYAVDKTGKKTEITEFIQDLK